MHHQQITAATSVCVLGLLQHLLHYMRTLLPVSRNTAATAQRGGTRKFLHARHAVDLRGLTAAQQTRQASLIGRASTAVHDW